jgi:hypothetical protein
MQADMTRMFDLVGDIHGHADYLQALLLKLGYQPAGAGFHHPQRQLIMVGDLIDRGPGQKRVVEIARAMVASGDALVLMGNHEFNAICYALESPNGGYIRPHNDANTLQHQAFLDEFPFGSVEHADALRFFRQLPLWFENDSFRVVHACWHQASMDVLDGWLDERHCPLGDDIFRQYGDKSSVVYDLIETVLKGPEIRLPEGVCFYDKDNKARYRTRINWWKLHHGEAHAFAVEAGVLAGHDMSASYQQAQGFRYQQDKPVFFGHYWQRNFSAEALKGQNAFCLDYSVAKQGELVAARWHSSVDDIEWVSVKDALNGCP